MSQSKRQNKIYVYEDVQSYKKDQTRKNQIRDLKDNNGDSMEVGRTKALALPDDDDSDDVIDFGDHIYNDGMYICPERE